MIESSDLIEELLALERETLRLSMRASDMERYRIPALEQGLSQLWTLPYQRRCTTTIEGWIIGGLRSPLVPMPDTTLKVVGTVTGTVYGEWAVPTGEYSIGLELDPADDTLQLAALGPVSPRFSATYGASVGTTSITHCVVNTIGYVTPKPATNYFYLEGVAAIGGCQYPIYVPGIVRVDSTHGTDLREGCYRLNTFAAPPYTAVTGVPCVFNWGGGQAYIQYAPVNQFDHQPRSKVCPVGGDPWFVVCGDSSDIASFTPPGVDHSTLWEMTWNCTDLMFHNGSGTMQFYENPP